MKKIGSDGKRAKLNTQMTQDSAAGLSQGEELYKKLQNFKLF